MYIVKKSLFSIALSGIVLFSSMMPAVAMERKSSHVSQPPVQRPGKKRLTKPINTQLNQSKSSAHNIKQSLTWKQQLRKKFRALKAEISEFVGENPVATFAAILGSALGLWLLWKVNQIPWEHREGVIGNSAGDIIQAQVPQGAIREINHVLFERAAGAAQDDVVRREIRAQFRLDNQAAITQVRAARQGFNGSCAYHAIKNCIVLLNELIDPQGNMQEQIEGNQVCQQLLGNNGRWRQLILADPANIRNGDCMRGGDWLSGAAVQLILDSERQPNNAQRLLRDMNVPITVIENAFNIAHPDHDPLFNATQVAHDALAHAHAGNIAYTHGFIFNTARTRIVDGQPQAPARETGHWMAAVVHRNAQGEVRWYVADSSNRSMLEMPVLQDLIAAVQGVMVQ